MDFLEIKKIGYSGINKVKIKSIYMPYYLLTVKNKLYGVEFKMVKEVELMICEIYFRKG